MNITTNGFYKIADLDLADGNMVIGDNVSVTLYDDGCDLKSIEVGENTLVKYVSFFCDEGVYRKHFISGKEGSKVVVKSLIYSEKNTIDAKILGELDADSTSNSIDVLSFAGEDGIIKLDGVLQINSALKKVDGRLDEENIFLGESGKISGIPTLLVETNDVEASHSCKMEKISDEKLFYLRSRGIDKENALRTMIEAKIIHLYSILEQENVDFFQEIVENICTKIK